MKKNYTFFLVCSSVLIFAQNYATNNIPESLLKNANTVIRENSADYILKSVNDLEIKNSSVVTILNSAGDDNGVVVISYNPTKKVSNIKVEMLDAAGKPVKTYSKKDFSDYTNNPNAGLYVDDRVLVLKPVSPKYPYSLKTTYEVNTSNTVYLSSFRPIYDFGISVEKSTFSVLNNSGIKVRTKINESPLAKVKNSENGNLWNYSFENIPAITHEDLAPSLYSLVPSVEFSPEQFSLEGKQGDMTSWDTFGKWYYEKLLTPVSAVTPEISAEVAALNLSGSTSEKVKTLYQYMQNKTRYVLIMMGIGGWQPMPASEVSKKGYGDCKALTNYMHTLLTAAGIPSYYAVIYDDNSVVSFDKNFPKLSGNHVILMVPTEKETIWLENTSQKIAFNHLSYSSHNRNVLAVKKEGIEIINTPVYEPSQSKEKLLAKIQIANDGGMTSDANFEFTGGQYDSNLRLFSLRNDELSEAMKNRYFNLKIDQLNVSNLKNDRDEAKIIYDLKVKANGFSKKIGEDLFFPVMPYYQATLFSSNDERKLPFENSFPFQDDYEIEYSIPAGYQFTEIPKSLDFSTEFGSYKINFDLKENKLLVHRILTIKKGLYAKEKFAEYLAFRKKTASHDNTKILISKI